MRFHYCGYPEYLARAVAELGLDGAGHQAAREEARRLPSLTRLSNLVVQALEAPAGHPESILAHGCQSRDALAICLRAAELILGDVYAAFGLEPPRPLRRPEPAVAADGAAERQAPPAIEPSDPVPPPEAGHEHRPFTNPVSEPLAHPAGPGPKSRHPHGTDQSVPVAGHPSVRHDVRAAPGRRPDAPHRKPHRGE